MLQLNGRIIIFYFIHYFGILTPCLLFFIIQLLFNLTSTMRMRVKVLSKIKQNEVILNDQRIKNEGLQFLCSQKVSHVTKLELIANQITGEGMLHFPKANWANLITLHLRDNVIGSIGCKYLSRASLNCIQNLWIAHNQIGSEGVLHLSKVQWNTLELINLSKNVVGVEGIRWLMSTKWSNIKRIYLVRNKLSEHQIIHFLLCEFKLIELIFASQTDTKQIRNEHLKKIYKDRNIDIHI